MYMYVDSLLYIHLNTYVSLSIADNKRVANVSRGIAKLSCTK